MFRSLTFVACTLLAVSLVSAAGGPSTNSLLDTIDYYEVIEVTSPTHTLSGPPPSLHTQSFDPLSPTSHTRASHYRAPTHPKRHAFKFLAHGKEFEIELDKNDNIFAPTYSESFQYWTSDGVRRRDLEPSPRTLDQVEHCYYKGRVLADGHSEGGRASIHTCDHGFNGMITMGSKAGNGDRDESYVIEPAHRHLDSAKLGYHVQSLNSALPTNRQRKINPTALHIVYKLRDLHAFKAFGADGFSGCGVNNPNVPSSTSSTDNEQGPHVHSAQLEFDPIEDMISKYGQQQVVEDDSSSPSSSSKASHRSLAASDPINPQRYVELLIANDKRRYAALGQATESRTAAIVNTISTLYSQTAFTPATLEIVLIGQVTFFNADPWNITTGGCSNSPEEICVDKLLSTWNEWRRNPDNTVPYQNNDAGHLFSGYKFQGVVLGYAGVGAMCTTSQSGGINQMTNSADSFNGVIAAHEIGHNLGMQHDSSGNACPESGFIMNAVVNSGSPPSAFSSCSMDYYNKWTLTGAGTCLNNVPTQRYGSAVCGNGYVEAGEQCDCGPYGSGKDSTNVAADFCLSTANPCCDPLSCQFIQEAECSNTDACCQNCKVTKKEENRVCRPASGVCDVAETCDGTSSACPFDDGYGNGKSCTLSPYKSGACFEGKCQSYQRQCDEISKVYSGGPWVTCPIQRELNAKRGSGYCGELFCQDSSDTTAGASQRCTYFDFSSAPEQMADGNPCGDVGADGLPQPDRLCYKGDCIAAESTNTRFQWHTSEWEKCNDCNTFQSRNVTCVRTATGQRSGDEMCTASAKPSSSQQCSDEELLCDHAITGSLSFTILGHEVLVSTPVVIGASVGIFVFLLLVLHGCVLCVSRRLADKQIKDHGVVPSSPPQKQHKQGTKAGNK